MDLGDIMDVHAIQLNFADDMENEIPCPGKMIQTPDAERYIDLNNHVTAWYLEGSLDGRNWFMLEDKRKTEAIRLMISWFGKRAKRSVNCALL